MENIKITGLELLNESEKLTLDKLIKENYPKIKRKIKNEISIEIYIKEYNLEGKRKKYSLMLDIKSETHHFKAEAIDWDFARTLHKLINKINEEIEHRFHASNQK